MLLALGNGFETSPTNAFADDGSGATDKDRGTNAATSCSDSGKDRHQYYNCNVSIPGGATIDGIDRGALDLRWQLQ